MAASSHAGSGELWIPWLLGRRVRPVRARSVLSTAGGRPADDLDRVVTDVVSNSAEVQQGSGVVSVQLEISVALAVLRVHAFAEAGTLSEVAMQVIAHRLPLGPFQDSSAKRAVITVVVEGVQTSRKRIAWL